MPGEYIKEAHGFVQNTYAEQGKLFSKILGLYDPQKNEVIPLEGAYIPHPGDEIVGIITSERNGVYEVDIQHFDRCLLISDKHDELMDQGEIISATVREVENRKTIIVEGQRRLGEGILLYIKPTKIPRVIGKSNTMINMISEYTKSRIVVGMNGLIWLNGGNTALATEALLRIENEAHVEGLTNRIKIMLEEKIGKKQG
ncbi:MAG: KH domain-containing protein [Candidatus Micrarchaeia archaeon]